VAKVKKSIPVETPGFIKIKVLKSLSGLFLMPENEGAIIEIPEAQANVIVESGYGEFVK
jgi:hypothetical protein